MSKEFVDWIIHYVANGAQCVECGKKEFFFFNTLAMHIRTVCRIITIKISKWY